MPVAVSKKPKTSDEDCCPQGTTAGPPLLLALVWVTSCSGGAAGRDSTVSAATEQLGESLLPLQQRSSWERKEIRTPNVLIQEPPNILLRQCSSSQFASGMFSVAERPPFGQREALQ